MARRLPLLVAVAVLSLWCSRADAQTPASFGLDTSPRSAALGGASTALFWGNDLNYWANPALVGYFHGLSYTYQRAQLIPGLSPTVAIQNQPIRIGGAGVGVVFAGEPLGRGAEIRIAGDNFDVADSWGFGVSAGELVRTIAHARGGEPPALLERVDVAYGMNFKEAEGTVLGVTEEADATDWGILVRGTPVLSEPHEASEFRLDLAYGHSALSTGDGQLFGADISEQVKDGIAARMSWNPWIRTLSDLPGGWFLEGFKPLLTVGAVAGWTDVKGLNDFETSGQGLEVDLANFVAVRVGHFRDHTGEIEGATWGFGLGLPVGSVGRLQYDSGLFPQAVTLDHRQQHGFTIWLDPIAAWRLRSGS